MSTTSSRNVIIISSTALVSLMLAACGGAKEAPVTVPAGVQAGDLVGLEPCAYKAGDVELAADCGTLVVPENRADPNSRLIALPVIRVRATGANPAEPIFRFSGGPGTSNLHFRNLEDVIENHDFVQVGYRGVNGSVVLDCPEISEAFREASFLLSDEALESYTVAGASCAGRLRTEGVDLAGYTIVETIEDYARLCAQHPECSARTEDLAASMRRVSADMPDRWLFFPIDEGSVKVITLIMLFESIQPPGVPVPLYGTAAIDMWLAAEGGDASGMALVSMIRNMFLPSLWTWGEGLSLASSVDDSLYTHQPLDFDVGLGWPRLAKLLVAVVVLVPILLLVLVWLIVRWVKRRRAGQVSG